MKKPSTFSPDIIEFLYLLSKYEVQYLLVGGEAVIFYGYARLTGDIDFFYKNTVENCGKLFDVLSEFWDGDIPGIKKNSDLVKKGMVLHFGVPPNRIDLLNDIDGVKFDNAWGRKVEHHIIRRRKKFAVYYIGINDLIRNKKTVRRNKDLDDMRFLIKARNIV